MTVEEQSVHYSEEQVSALMDDMVDAWYEFQASSAEWSNARNNIQQPQKPEQFSSAKSLSEYRRAEAEWLRQLKEVDSRHRGHNQRFESVASQVTEVLPQDVPIEHTYQGDNPERSGTYVITHTLGDYKQIKVERAAG
jgi:hypothetical protein